MKKIALLLAGVLLMGSIAAASNNSIVTQAQTTTRGEESGVLQEENLYKEAMDALEEELQKESVMAVVYMAEEYPLYSLPGQTGCKLADIPSGTTVYIEDVAFEDSKEYSAGFEAWYQVRVPLTEGVFVGYVDRSHLAISDEDFLQWEESYGTDPAIYEMDRYTDGAVTYTDVQQFPASYQSALMALKSTYPKWIFVPQNLNLDWNYVVQEEMKGGRSLISTSKGDYMYTTVHSPGWGYATEGALKYYMDPRNGLTQDRVFQFEQLTYNGTYHTENALKIFLNNTFMGNGALMPQTALTYSYGIWAIGANAVNTSPFHLASRIYQEQGRGTSPLISGTYPGYEGYYNFFNVKASGSTNEEIYVNGLTYAKNAGWTDGYKSILGGAELLAKSYIGVGQDTLYLQKYDMVGTLFTHQYMQNIMAPTSEGISTYKMYRDSNALDNTFVFKIPVYNNMPESACPEPTATPTPTPTPIVTPAPRPTPDAETVAKVEAFVERMYTVALGREADASGVDYWTDLLVSYVADGAGIARGFLLGSELVSKNYSNAEYVEVLYKTIMSRDADDAGLSYWKGILDAGTTREAVLAGFVNSNEFDTLCMNYSISRGYMREDGSILNPGIYMFASRLYSKILGRVGDKDGKEYWALQIVNKECLPEEAAQSFFWSAEYVNKQTSNEEYIRALYATFMDRDADSEGIAYWQQVLAGGVSRDDVLKSFAQSTEFRGIMASYGL